MPIKVDDKFLPLTQEGGWEKTELLQELYSELADKNHNYIKDGLPFPTSWEDIWYIKEVYDETGTWCIDED